MYRDTTDVAHEMCDYKGTAILVQAWIFPEASWGLRFPDCNTIGT